MCLVSQMNCSKNDGRAVDSIQRNGRPGGCRVGEFAGVAVFGMAILFLVFAAVRFGARSQGVNLFRQPALVVEPKSIELGEVPPDTTIPVSVRVTNGGGGQLLITAVKGSCDACIQVVSYPEKPIGAGESSQIHLEIDTRGTSGIIQKQALIQCNDWTGKPQRLRIQWAIRNKADP